MGTPEELFEAPAHSFVGYFIGSPGMNFIDAQVQGRHARLPDGQVIDLGADFGTPSGSTRIGVRPEHVILSKQGLPVRIRRIEDVGRHRILRGELAGADFNILLPEDAPPPGAEPRAAFLPGKTGVYVDDWRVNPQSLERVA